MSATPWDQPGPAQRAAIASLPASLHDGIARARASACRDFMAQFDPGSPSPAAYVNCLRAARAAVESACWPVPKNHASIAPGSGEQMGPTADFIPRLAAEKLASPPVPLTIPNALAARLTVWSAEPRVAPMREIAEALPRLLPEGIRPALFGSLAGDSDWPLYSDVDLALFASRPLYRGDVAAIARAWRAIMPILLRIDPVQHHGPYLFFENDAALFWPSLLPVGALERATMLDGRPLALAIRPLEDRILSIDALLAAYAGVKKMAGRARVESDRYSAKMLGSLALLAPALAAGALGMPMEKGAAFDWFKKGADEPTRAALERVERWRRQWHDAFQLPASMMKLAGVRAARASRQLNRFPSLGLMARTREMLIGADKVFLSAFARLAAEEKP